MTVGTKWYKCDLHLHTPASKCFKDQTVTPEQWVQAALDKGLNCVAVTDHNTGAWIDKIKEAAQGKGLVVYPGVELTCSDAKVHLLILFDTDKGTTEIEDFILLTGIERAKFGEQDAHSPKSAEDIFKLALDKKAICIPAHIDEFNGISEIANAPRLAFLDNKDLLGVQVVHELMTKPDKDYNPAKNTNLEHLNRYYRLGEQQIAEKKWKVNEERMKNWRQAVLQSQEKNKAILTFSDNPHEEKDSQHGIWGIGTRYSWIKMDQNPGLEGLRQALLLHKFRIRNDFECPNGQKPYHRPEVLIHSVRIANTQISNPEEALEVQFSPQMTTIIGGRGSGKSTVIQVLRGIFGKERELESLEIVLEEFKRFFRVPDARKKYGILQNACSFEMELEREGETYRLKYTHINNAPTIELTRLNAQDHFEPIPDHHSYLPLLDFEIFSQKQIYELATNLGTLREKIDVSDDQLQSIKQQLLEKKDAYKQKCGLIRALEHKIKGKGPLEANIAELIIKIERYKESDLEEYIQKIQDFDAESTAIVRYLEQMNIGEQYFNDLLTNLNAPSLALLMNEDSRWRGVFEPLTTTFNSSVAELKARITSLRDEYQQAITRFNDEVDRSAWSVEKAQVKQEFQERKDKLHEAGFEDVSKIDTFLDDLKNKQKELEDLRELEKQIELELVEKTRLKSEYIGLRQKLTTRRDAFLKGLLSGRNVRAKVGKFRDFNDLEKQVRRISGADSAYVAEIDDLVNFWTEGDGVKNNEDFNKHIADILDGGNKGDWDKRFSKKIRELSGENLDEFDLLFPEDEIIIEYQNGAGYWKPISAASAGQKTAAILTLILSHGKKPLLLDQPEDDLDNRLIYDLVVDQLRISKETRQIIVVTHNANIPVNGDSEHIIVMDAESKYIKPLTTGCIEEPDIKSAICEIMEGGTEAFNMRSERYKNL
ncbi:MAG: AAA family ATPase [Haliscomenobacter sp.]|uniref:TrlF family AAA-like ATPase n=1 Tax=Haliscomenobacter sp. TaxID=2717303 RepID=UPI0029A127D5|nr:AAA family ATPase [Haliscomenobacter sp.]MDX2067062.1 AAA family ATPase [Haliscomenobacter sp.]